MTLFAASTPSTARYISLITGIALIIFSTRTLAEIKYDVINLGTIFDSSSAYGIYNNGQIVGNSKTDTKDFYKSASFIWDETNGMRLSSSVAGFSISPSIHQNMFNDNGQFVYTQSNHGILWDEANGVQNLYSLKA